MTNEPFYKSHWRKIEPERMLVYRGGFKWDENTNDLYKPACISEGQTVADFGCGPGHVAVELARRVGVDGHVHALDINSEFLEITRSSAETAGVSERVTTHLNDGISLPFENASLDRVSARNSIMYVDDPVTTLQEFHRVLRPGGIAHSIDGDRYMMVAEPVGHDLWREFVKAASHACRNADMGRKLYDAFTRAGFDEVDILIRANPDVDGRQMGMIRNMANYARESGRMPLDRIELVVETAKQALVDGTYLVISPQFIVTGQKAG